MHFHKQSTEDNMGEFNKKRCAICNQNSDHLKIYRGQRICPDCLDHELGRQDFFATAPFTMGGMPIPR